MDLKIAIVGISLAGQQRLELFFRANLARSFQGGLGLGNYICFTLSLTKLDQLQGFVDLIGQPGNITDGFFQLGSLSQYTLGPFLVVPEIRVDGKCVQLFQAQICLIPVKDASGAIRLIDEFLPPWLQFPRA